MLCFGEAQGEEPECADIAGVTRDRGHPPVAELDAGAQFANAPGEPIEQALGDRPPDLTQPFNQVGVLVEVLDRRASPAALAGGSGVWPARLVCIRRWRPPG